MTLDQRVFCLLILSGWNPAAALSVKMQLVSYAH